MKPKRTYQRIINVILKESFECLIHAKIYFLLFIKVLKDDYDKRLLSKRGSFH